MKFTDRFKSWARSFLAADPPTDSTLTLGSYSAQSPQDRDRYQYDREDLLAQSLEAWRTNPLARRIIALVSQYVVGGGVELSCKHPAAGKFLNEFWRHPLNRMPSRIYEWCDELSRSGNLFILLVTDQAGMSFVRAIPAAQINAIDHRPNDIEQPTLFYLKPTIDDPDPAPIPAYNPAAEVFTAEGSFAPVMLHYAINRPAGAQWGEPDLAPVLKWLSRYSNWLEDRARLNRYRNAFLYVVKGRYVSETDRQARQRTLNAQPPTPGSILVADTEETWEVVDPKLDSADSAPDGLALKKMIAAGAGIPLHFLAEPESSTRTTAEASGGPTFRHFEQRQQFFLWLLTDLLQAVINRRSIVGSSISHKVPFQVLGADISARDNQSLSAALANIEPALADLRSRNLIDDAELLRLVYRFAGETIDIEEMLARGKAALPVPPPARQNVRPKSDPSVAY